MEINMAPETDEATKLAEAEDAAFASGFPEKGAEKTPDPPAKPEPAAPESAPAKVEEKPEYVQIGKKEWDEVRAAAAKTASYDAQLSKLFGTTGNLQSNLQKLTATKPATEVPRKVELPKDAFAAMERDFPELAQQTRAALEAALAGIPAGSDIDAAKVEGMLATFAAKREIEALEDDYPEWRKIVGAVDITREQPDANNPFRLWLATKDATYQARINGSESAAVIARAIRTFQTETKAPPALPAKTPRSDARAERLKEAVQPRGDNAGAAPGKSDDDEFLAGFNSR